MWRSGRRPGASSLLLLLHRAAVAVSAAVCCRCCCCVLPGCLGVHCEGLAAAAGAFGIGVDKHKLRPAPAVCWGRKIARASTGHHQTQPMSSTQGGNKPASRGLGRHSLQCQPSPASAAQSATSAPTTPSTSHSLEAVLHKVHACAQDVHEGCGVDQNLDAPINLHNLVKPTLQGQRRTGQQQQQRAAAAGQQRQVRVSGELGGLVLGARGRAAGGKPAAGVSSGDQLCLTTGLPSGPGRGSAQPAPTHPPTHPPCCLRS